MLLGWSPIVGEILVGDYVLVVLFIVPVSQSDVTPLERTPALRHFVTCATRENHSGTLSQLFWVEFI